MIERQEFESNIRLNPREDDGDDFDEESYSDFEERKPGSKKDIRVFTTPVSKLNSPLFSKIKNPAQELR